MHLLYADTETFSDEPINNGTYKYAESAEVMLFAYAWNDEPPVVADFTRGQKLPEEVLQALATGKRGDEPCAIVFHNSQFDRVVIRASMGIDIPTTCIIDTMVLALQHSLPGGLGKLSAIFRLGDESKKDGGKALIQLFCKPQPKKRIIRRATWQTHPEEWAEFVEYAGADILSMRALLRVMPKWNAGGREAELWRLDQKINDRGYCVDMPLVRAATKAAAAEKARLAAQTSELTDEEVTNTTQRAKLKRYLADHGVSLPDMQTSTLTRRLEDASLPWSIKALITNRLQASMTSVSKFNTLLRVVCRDGRVRGSLVFCGAARTGRWAGRLFQPQNLTRTPKYLSKVVDMLIRALKLGMLDSLYSNVMETISACVRGAIIAAPGKKLTVADLANIEGRVLAWLVGETWKLQAFRDYDAGIGPDLYVLAYSRSFKVPVAEVLADVEAGGTFRQVGKVQELALGYQGAVGAFASMADVYGLKLIDEEEVEQSAELLGMTVEQATADAMVDKFLPIVKAHRAANPATVRFWYAVERAAVHVITTDDKRVRVGRVVLDFVSNWLRIQLPSGRYLCYPSARVDERGKLSYMGIDPYTRQWTRLKTYGGKLTENISQAIARDVLAEGMLLAEACGYHVLLTVHDELVTETPDNDFYSHESLSDLMANVPAWAEGLPLAAEGYEAKRYRK